MWSKMAKYYLTERDKNTLQEVIRKSKLQRSFQEAASPRLFGNEGGTDIKIYEVVSDATGDGVYNCKEMRLISDEWPDTGGADRFEQVSAATVEVLHLQESDTESNYTRMLTPGDRMFTWEIIDSAGNKRRVGDHINDYQIGITRSASIKTVNTDTFTCNLWSWNTTTWVKETDDITVTPIKILGSNSLAENVWPKLAAGDDITVYREQDLSWTTPLVFDDTTDCDS
jgi:hypothetical protein